MWDKATPGERMAVVAGIAFMALLQCFRLVDMSWFETVAKGFQ